MADEIEPGAVAPVEPVAPVVDPVAPIDTVAPTPEEAAEAAEAAEWDDAANEIFPGLKSTQKKEDKKDEPAKPVEEPAKAETPVEGEIDPNETPEQKAEREAKAKEAEGEASDEDGQPDSTARDARIAARENARVVEEVRADVRKQMFANVPTVLADGDGDPINSVADVMRLINPNTGEAFTEAEAQAWLPAAQARFDKSRAEIEGQLEHITQVQMEIIDQSHIITEKYGELLKAMPELRDELWAEYEKSLKKDPESGLYTEMPQSLERFYELALRPYATQAQKAEVDADAAAKAEADAKVAAETAAKEAAEAKAKKRADRSDIFGGGKVDTMDDDEKEWADAAEKVFGPRK